MKDRLLKKLANIDKVVGMMRDWYKDNSYYTRYSTPLVSVNAKMNWWVSVDLPVINDLSIYPTEELYLIRGHIEEDKDLYVCPRCGSTNVQEKAWVWSNTLQLADSIDITDCWCEDCGYAFEGGVLQSDYNRDYMDEDENYDPDYRDEDEDDSTT